MKTVLRLVASLLAAVALACAGFVYVVRADRRFPVAVTPLVVPQGLTASGVARLLRERGVIGSALAFRALARVERKQTDLRAGEYRFPAHETLDEVLQRMTVGGSQVAVWVTVPEGFTAREIAATLEARGLGPAAAYDAYFLHTSLALGHGERSRSLEGFLFPDTYLVPVDATPASVAAIMTDRFRERVPEDAAARARRNGLSIAQVVTLASLVEREAKADDERALMAGVYYNRLRLGMPLEVDATIEYTFAHHKDVITRADLARDSPYNTYEHTGLPPTPIANPGAPSLAAAFHPQPSGYLYYVYKGNGHHAFSRTLAEHNENVARYLR